MMRTKDEILGATIRNSKIASSPKDISLIHELHTLEVLIDIRDILNDRLNFIYRLFQTMSYNK